MARYIGPRVVGVVGVHMPAQIFGDIMDYRLVIVGDTNDADYVTEISKIDQETLDNIIRPVAKLIKNCTEHYNWNDSEYQERYPRALKSYNFDEKPHKLLFGDFDQDTLQHFSEYCPCFEGGIHSIESITITPWVEEENLLV